MHHHFKFSCDKFSNLLVNEHLEEMLCPLVGCKFDEEMRKNSWTFSWNWKWGKICVEEWQGDGVLCQTFTKFNILQPPFE